MTKKGFSGREKDKGSRFKGKVFHVEEGAPDANWGPTEAELERMKWRPKKEEVKSDDGDSSEDDTSGKSDEETSDEESASGSSDSDGESGDETNAQETYNPNRMPQTSSKAFQSAEMMGGGRLTRRERELLDKEQSQKRAWELYEKGLSELAKRDFIRLEEVKIRREAERAARLARVAAQKSSSTSLPFVPKK